LLTLARTLAGMGHSVTCHAHEGDAALAAELGVTLEVVPVWRYPRKLQDLWFFRSVRRAAPGIRGRQIALCRVPVRDVIICGGTHRGYMRQARKWAGVFDRLQFWMEARAYGSAKKVISHSDLCTRELVGLYRVPESRIVTLYPPVDAQFCPARNESQRTESRRRLGLPEDRVVLLFPSTGHRRKGLYPICRALGGLSDRILLAVAGDPPRAGRLPWVRHLGYLADMAEAYRAADFTILGSLYEPFGLVGPESVLCGTRLIFEERIGCLAAIRREFVFPFSVWESESIRQAVSRAVEMAREGRHRIENPLGALRYDPSPEAHAMAMCRLLES